MTQMTYEAHDLAKLFPPMPEDEFLDLVLDIKHNGLLEPIKLYQDKILDGWNRYNACVKAGVEPRFEVWTNPDGGEAAIGYVLSRNLFRRHLAGGQRAFVVMKAHPELAARVGTEKSFNTGGDKRSANKITNGPRPVVIPASQILADRAGVAVDTIQRAARVQREAPDLVPQVEAGRMSVEAADEKRLERRRQEQKMTQQEAATSRRFQWKTRVVAEILEALDAVGHDLGKIQVSVEAAAHGGRFAPEAKAFTIRRLAKLTDRINDIEGLLQ